MDDAAIWTIVMSDRTMAVLIIAFALWIFLTLALLRSNIELRKRVKPLRNKWEDC